MQQPSLRYSRVVFRAIGVICRSCGRALEIEDAYIPAVHTAAMAATLYPGFGRARGFKRRLGEDVDLRILRTEGRLPWARSHFAAELSGAENNGNGSG